jgi:hypothetical protein
MIQSIKPEELDKFNDLLIDHLNELTTELKLCTDSKINKLLRAEVSNITSMINGLSKHKLFANNYEKLTKVGSSEDDEPAPPKRASKQKKKQKLNENSKHNFLPFTRECLGKPRKPFWSPIFIGANLVLMKTSNLK